MPFASLYMISIHAPQWGATAIPCWMYYGTEFQSTHPSGVRQPPESGDNPTGGFQSTHPSGVRLVAPIQWREMTFISIHAPQWGATSSVTGLRLRPVFQSTHPSGVRPCRRNRPANPRNFNPRTPVGCDSYPTSARCRPTYFNPRTPVGCDDLDRIRLRQFQHISIHAPQWGATARDARAGTLSVFQSTHPSGVRR